VWSWLNSIGLMLGMVGVVIIFFWPPPLASFNTEVLLSTGKISPEAIARNRRHTWLSGIGLGLIFFGFLAQFVGTLPSS
jgi:hypothetical protein